MNVFWTVNLVRDDIGLVMDGGCPLGKLLKGLRCFGVPWQIGKEHGIQTLVFLISKVWVKIPVIQA